MKSCYILNIFFDVANYSGSSIQITKLKLEKEFQLKKDNEIYDRKTIQMAYSNISTKKRSPFLNPVETKVYRNLKKDVCICKLQL